MSLVLFIKHIDLNFINNISWHINDDGLSVIRCFAEIDAIIVISEGLDDWRWIEFVYVKKAKMSTN